MQEERARWLGELETIKTEADFDARQMSRAAPRRGSLLKSSSEPSFSVGRLEIIGAGAPAPAMARSYSVASEPG